MLTLERVALRLGGFALAADWAAEPGARIALIGPSGAGKSTLLLAVAGFVGPARGRILWRGRDLAATAPGDRPVSVLFQDQNLFPHLTLAQNLELGLTAGRRPDAGQRRAVGAALARVGLEGMGHRRPAQVSGGQQARAALARALLRARPVLLLDEPFAALGPAMKADMLDLVAEVADETRATVLMATHDAAEARRLCPLAVVVEGGTAHAPQSTARLLDDPPPALRAYLGR